MLVHEVGEVLGGVLAPTVLGQQVVEIGEHLVDRGPVGVGGVLHRLLHAREPLVEQLAAEQVLDPLVVLTRLAALPVVLAELADRGRGRGRQVVELELAQRAVTLVEVDVAGQLLAFVEHGPVEQLADLLQRAVEVVALGQLATLLGDPAGQVVEAALVRAAASQELAHRPLRAVAGHHVLADRVECLGDVDGRSERVGPPVVRRVARAWLVPTHGHAPRSCRRAGPAGSRRPRRRGPGPG